MEACLHNGIRVNKYFPLDLNIQARRVACKVRLESISAAHPQHFPPEAWRDAFEAIPQDASSVTAWHLHRTGVGTGNRWLLIAYPVDMAAG